MYNRSTEYFDAKAFGRVAVLFGGNSAEREVSLTSGERVYAALVRSGIECQLIDTAGKAVEQIMAYQPDRVFVALHGTGGEDGTIQGVLEYLDIPYTGSKVLASALAMDKYRCKLLWESIGLPTPDFRLVNCEEDLEYCEDLLPVFVKPSMEGSSVGIGRVNRKEDLFAAWEKAAVHHGSVLVEQLVEGPEFTVGILNGQALPAIRIEAKTEFYDYEAKYLSDDTGYVIPCGLSKVQEQEMQAVALTAFESLDCSGYGRVDFMQDPQGRFWLLEVNTLPGMTDHSLLPMAAKDTGLSFDQLIVEILKTTMPVQTEKNGEVQASAEALEPALSE